MQRMIRVLNGHHRQANSQKQVMVPVVRTLVLNEIGWPRFRVEKSNANFQGYSSLLSHFLCLPEAHQTDFHFFDSNMTALLAENIKTERASGKFVAAAASNGTSRRFARIELPCYGISLPSAPAGGFCSSLSSVFPKKMLMMSMKM